MRQPGSRFRVRQSSNVSGSTIATIARSLRRNSAAELHKVVSAGDVVADEASSSIAMCSVT
jgi:hypothetical protein